MLTWRILRLLLMLSPCALALDPNRTLTQYAHRIWDQEEGLSQPTVYSILQTRNGFLWLGTQDSLIRFDGKRFRDFGDAEDPQFQHSLVRSLYEDPQGNLWIGTIGSGLAKLAPNGVFTHYTTKQGLPSNEVFCVVPDAQNTLWICTNRGLAHFNHSVFQIFTTADGLTSNLVRSTCLAPDGTRWVAALDAGLSRSNSRQFTPYFNGLISPKATITALDCAKNGIVWVGKDSGLVSIEGPNLRSYTTRDGLPDNEVSSLAHDPDGSLWIGSHDGISRLRQGEIATYRTRDGLSHSSVLSLQIDREGSLWAGTKNGLDQFTDASVIPYTVSEGMLSSNVGPVLEDGAGRLWIGTLDLGLNLFNGHRFTAVTTSTGLIDNHILSLELDSSGDLWVGTRKGINRLHNGVVVAAYTQRNGLCGREIRALAIDQHGTLWAGTEKGLALFDGHRFRTPVGAASLTASAVLALTRGRAVSLFASTDEPGLYLLRENVFTRTALSGIARPISSYYFDHIHHVAWMGTLGSGLLRWQNGNIMRIRVSDGLYDNRIYGILRDDSSNLWMASSKGIFRISERDLDEFASGKRRSVTSIPFSTGQLRFECQSGVQPAACRTRDGRLWFSTTSGLVVIDPAHLQRNKVPPPVQITSTLVNGERLDFSRRNRLKPFEKNLEIRYTGLTFISPEKVTFRYILEGFDKKWTEAGSRREAFFTNLPAGHYLFKVQSRSADGIWSARDASVGFSITPFFFETPWFWAVVASVFGLLAAAAYRMRIRKIQDHFDVVLVERARIARELHDTLLQGLSGVTMELQALWKKLPVSRERDTLAEIIQDAGQCSTEARQSLWGLRIMGVTRGGFCANLAKIARQAVAGSRIHLELDLQRSPLNLPPKIEFELLRIAQEAIFNSVRHAAADTLQVSFRFDDDSLTLGIRDDGDGFPASLDYSTQGHFGLLGIRERAQGIGATLTIDSTPGLGTKFALELPLSPTAERSTSNAVPAPEHQLE